MDSSGFRDEVELGNDIGFRVEEDAFSSQSEKVPEDTSGPASELVYAFVAP